MECIRGVYTSLRYRRSHRSASTEAYAQSQDSYRKRESDSQAATENLQEHGNEPSSLRTFFGSLLSIRSRTSNQAFHFDKEIEEDKNAAPEEGDRGRFEGQQSFEYTRKETAVIKNNVNEKETHEGGISYDNEAAEIVPYAVAEQRIEESEQAEYDEEHEEMSETEVDNGDSDIYPYPQPVNKHRENRRMTEDSEIEVILSSTYTGDDNKQIRQEGEDEGNLRRESENSGKKSDDNSHADVSLSQTEAVCGISKYDETQDSTDGECKEIYVSRNIPLEISEFDLRVVSTTSKEKINTEAEVEQDERNGSIEKEYQVSDESRVNKLDERGSEGNLDGEIEDNDLETQDIMSEGEDFSNKGLSNETGHDNVTVGSESDEERSITETGNISNDFIITEEYSESETSDSDQSSSTNHDQSHGSSVDESNSLHIEQSQGTGVDSEAEGEDKSSENSLPIASYMKNNIQITIIGEVDEEIVETSESGSQSVGILKSKDEDTISSSSDTDKYQLI